LISPRLGENRFHFASIKGAQRVGSHVSFAAELQEQRRDGLLVGSFKNDDAVMAARRPVLGFDADARLLCGLAKAVGTREGFENLGDSLLRVTSHCCVVNVSAVT
jgi:hypothetical protein